MTLRGHLTGRPMGKWISYLFGARVLRRGATVGAAMLSTLVPFCVPTLVTAQTYQVTDLGTLGGAYSYAYGINSSGKVVGESTTSTGETHAFLFDGTMHDLGTIAGTYSSANGISDNGLIAGQGSSSVVNGIFGPTNGPTHAFLYDGAMHDLGAPNGPGNYSYGEAVNNAGQVAVLSGSQQGFLYDGILHPLGTLGGTASHVHAIDNAGRIVGDAYLPGNIQRAALHDGTWHDLGTLGGTRSVALGLSPNGLVTGASLMPGDVIGAEHPFLYDGTMHDLGVLGGVFAAGTAVNSSGQVTGRSNIDSSSTQHAFLYSSAMGIVDLNSLIDPSSGWILVAGNGINNAGQITGVGTTNRQTHAFLLTPLPEPGLLASVAAVLRLTVARRRRT
jgi:probable HAF family extracellular repeat protein